MSVTFSNKDLLIRPIMLKILLLPYHLYFLNQMLLWFSNSLNLYLPADL